MGDATAGRARTSREGQPGPAREVLDRGGAVAGEVAQRELAQRLGALPLRGAGAHSSSSTNSCCPCPRWARGRGCRSGRGTRAGGSRAGRRRPRRRRPARRAAYVAAQPSGRPPALRRRLAGALGIGVGQPEGAPAARPPPSAPRGPARPAASRRSSAATRCRVPRIGHERTTSPASSAASTSVAPPAHRAQGDRGERARIVLPLDGGQPPAPPRAAVEVRRSGDPLGHQPGGDPKLARQTVTDTHRDRGV